MGDIASEADVSAMTVSRVLHRPEIVSQETRDRVLAIIERLGYVPDQLAGALSSRRSGFVAMIIPSLNNSNFADTARGLMDVLHEKGLQILVGLSDYSIRREEEMIETMLKRRPEGIVIVGARANKTARARHLLKMSRIPVIETWDIPDRPVNHVVGFSNFQATYLSVRHLWSCGYRRIAYLGGTTPGTRGNKRLAGYMAAQAELGATPRLVETGPLPALIEHGHKAFASFLVKNLNADAVICVSDLVAFGFLMECQRHGLDVPQRIGVAGFGDFDIGRWSFPTLTTVRVGSYEMGIRAAELMLNAVSQVGQGHVLEPMVVTVDVMIVPRESTKET